MVFVNCNVTTDNDAKHFYEGTCRWQTDSRGCGLLNIDSKFHIWT